MSALTRFNAKVKSPGLVLGLWPLVTMAGEGAMTDEPMQEITVTGTRIASDPIVAPVVVDRAQIEAAGYSRIDQVLQDLPQFFRGGASLGVSSLTVSAGPNAGGAQYNDNASSGANLRGLGTSSTLTLLNGRRIAPTNDANAVDISSIPVAAIERVEVLLDGASAIYGSDAIAGVVNIITLKNYSGFETRARYGSVTDGSKSDVFASQLAGFDWGSGNLTLAYTYADEEALLAGDRPFAAARGAGSSLTPDTRSHQFYGSLRQDIGSRLTASLDVLASRRDFSYVNEATPVQALAFSQFGSADATNATLSLQYALTDAWRVNLSATHALQQDERSIDYSTLSVVAKHDIEYTVRSAEAYASGPVFQAPGGAAQLALGLWRLDEKHPVAVGERKRESSAVFAEMSLPFIGSDNRMTAVHSLDLRLAARYEDYSDFGSETSPKVAVAWSPIEPLRMHVGYSESFKAPSLSNLSAGRFATSNYVLPVPDPQSPFGFTGAIIRNGANADLIPETAKVLDAGLSLQFTHQDSSYSASLRYSDIEFKNRIRNVYYDALVYFLTQESIYGPFVTRNPSRSQIDAVLDDPTINSHFLVPITRDQIGAIADLRIQNAGVTDMRALDLSARYSTPWLSGRLRADLSVSQMLEFDERVTVGGPHVDFLGMMGRPAKTRGRLALGFDTERWGSNVSLNHTGSLTDNTSPGCASPGATCRVGTWTRIDANLYLRTPATAVALWSDLRIALNVVNLFDKDPPHVGDLGGLGFDPSNADALGRFVSLELTKRW